MVIRPKRRMSRELKKLLAKCEVDVLPGVNAGDSSCAAHAGLVPASQGPALR